MNTPPVTPQKSSQGSPCSSTYPLSSTPSASRKRKHEESSPASRIAGLQLLSPPSDRLVTPKTRRPGHGLKYQQYGTSLVDHEAYSCISQLSACTEPPIPQTAIDSPSGPHLDLEQVAVESNAAAGCTDEYQDQTFEYLLQDKWSASPNLVRADSAAADLDLEYSPCSWSNPSGSVDAEICYGMIRLEPFDPVINSSLLSFSRNIHVVNDIQLTHDGVVTLIIGSSLAGQGNIPERLLIILSRLEQQSGVTLQFHCVITRASNVPNSKRNTPSHSYEAQLFAIIYGPEPAFDSIGDFLDGCGPSLCLQDPQGCVRNVPYRNPHRLTGWDDEVPMTIDRDLEVDRCLRNTRPRESDDWDEVALHKDLPLAPTPAAVQSCLYPYQAQALSFMCKRERGWDWQDDIWTQERLDGQIVYRNALTDEDQLQEPAPFCGGLLADQMGLGKTLTIIALVASDLEPLQSTTEQHSIANRSVASNYSRCTLVVVPPNLLTTWDYQLQLHTRPGHLQWSKHHDSSRFSALSQLEPFNIILTTYNTVATEWRRKRQNSLLFSTRWHRIVLDEAHCIREERTQLARAICDLQADRRWAVTGTPIQNHLSDLVALLKFLQLDPYSDHHRFAKDIIKYWGADPQAAVARLKRLISCITLRRTSKEIDIPSRTDLDVMLTFSESERALYETIEGQILASRPSSESQHLQSSRIRGHRVHGLHLLRFICSFGILADTSHFRMDENDGVDSTWSFSDAQKLFNTMVSSGMTKCSRCIADAANLGDEAADYQPSIFGEELLISQCGQILCANCLRDVQAAGESSTGWCDCTTPECPALSMPLVEITDVQKSMAPIDGSSTSELPTKTRALVADVSLHQESKSVVFSAWRTTLDLAERGLKEVGIQYTRFDGEVKSQAERALALERFRTDPQIKVILITLSCGAVGLDLTVANRAYMMEPQWNPTVEEQALARVHRMGQKKLVTTIRFTMSDSIEQRVVEVQSQKRSFADVLLCASKGRSSSKVSVGTFSRWKSLLT